MVSQIKKKKDRANRKRRENTLKKQQEVFRDFPFPKKRKTRSKNKITTEEENGHELYESEYYWKDPLGRPYIKFVKPKLKGKEIAK